MRKDQGIVLMTAMLVSFFLFVIGLAFLSFLERDAHLQFHADLESRAQYAARAGVEYFCYNNWAGRDTALTPGLPPGGPYLESLNDREFFSVQVSGTGKGCVSTGCVNSTTGEILARRVLVVRDNNYLLPLPENLSDGDL